ncbi:YkgJ family cysteine cluster protein [Thermogutta sp.]|uniref:YkgJ family cysteine cluster protein n=1 Tax=Thermogutta sp. TaxID=1962930 RepID=UPI0032205998
MRKDTSTNTRRISVRRTSPRPWYAAGLRFECTGCGYCCSGQPGYVYVTEEEIGALAERLRMEIQEFETQFVRLLPSGEKSLVERPNGDCVFLDLYSRRCLVYEVRPRQCRSFPFWPSQLRTERDWEKVCRTCPGCGRGRVYSQEEIEQLARLIDI